MHKEVKPISALRSSVLCICCECLICDYGDVAYINLEGFVESERW